MIEKDFKYFTITDSKNAQEFNQINKDLKKNELLLKKKVKTKVKPTILRAWGPNLSLFGLYLL